MLKERCLILSLIIGVFMQAGVCRGQGEVEFGTKVQQGAGGMVEARVTYLDGVPVGGDFSAQLYVGPAGTPLSSLEPILPVAQFGYMNRPEWYGYVASRLVSLPGIGAGEQATIVMKAYNGATWEGSLCRGESNPVTIFLSGGSGPSALLVGLQGFRVNCIPEPETLALLGCGAWLLAFWRRKMEEC